METVPPQPSNPEPPGVNGVLPAAPPPAETHPRLDTLEEFHPALDTEEEFHPALDHETFDAVSNDQTETADVSAPQQPVDPSEPLNGGQTIGLENAPSTVNGPAKGSLEASPARGTLEDSAMEDGFGGQEGELTDGGGVMVADPEQGVARGASGVGRPYAPATWQWKIPPSARVLSYGYYVDVVRKPPNGRDLKSIVQCKSYLKDELGLSDAEVEACLNTFEARIPASKEVLLADGIMTPNAKTKSVSAEADGAAEEEMVITPQNVVPEDEDEQDEDTSTEYMLDEFLKSPENWGSIGWRLRGPQGKTQSKELLEKARSRGETPEQSLKRLKLRVLKFPVFLRSEELEALPQSLLTLVVLVMTEGAVYEAKSRRMLNAELVLIIREELTRHQRAHGLDAYGNELKLKEKKAKKVHLQDPGSGPGRKRKSRPSFEEESNAKRKRKSLNDISDKKETHRKETQKKETVKKETHLVSRLFQLKPSLSGLSVEVDDDDPEEETVEQPVTPSRTPESATDALNAALEAAAGTPTGAHPAHAPSPSKVASPAFASPLFFANQTLNEEVRTASGNAQGPSQEAAPSAEASVSPMQTSPIPPPLAPAPPAPKPPPLTVEQLEIVHYRKKLVKLERKRRQWEKAFEQKLAAYRSKREALETQLETRRADQEAQKIKVVEETERLREARATALQELRALQAAADLPDVAEAELEKRGSFEGIYTAAVDEVRKAKKKAWEEMKKGVNEVKRSNLEQMRKKVEAYRQLGLAVPQSEIEEEREQYSAEITEMQAKLEAQKVLLDAALADLEQKTSAAKGAYDEYKARCKSLEKEEARLQRLLQERIA